MKTAEEVSFAANGITAAGLRAFDGVLQSNITLKTLDLSGNLVGDEGAKVSPKCFSEFKIWVDYCYSFNLYNYLKGP